MFCTECGTRSEANLRFCTNCGESLEQRDVGAPGEAPPIFTEAPPPVAPPAMAPQPPKAACMMTRHIRACIAALVALIFVAMMPGWFNMNLDMPRIADELLSDMLTDSEMADVRSSLRQISGGEFAQSYSVHGLANLSNVLVLVLDFVYSQAHEWGMSDADLREFRDLTEPIRSIPGFINIARIVFGAISALLLVYLYLLVSQTKGATAVGIAAALLALILSAGVIALMFIADTLLTGGFYSYTLSASVWTYVAAGASLASLILLCVFSKKLQD